MSRAHPLMGVDVAVVPVDGLLDPVRAHLPEGAPSFVWAPDPGPGRRSGRRRKRPRARTGRTGRLRLMVKDLEDPRRAEPPKDGLGEREMLEAWLEFHRTTLLLRCEGADDHARKARPVATSRLSLHGLVRRMAEVERSWFRRVLQREPGAPYIWYTPPSKTARGSPGRRRVGSWPGGVAGRVSGEPEGGRGPQSQRHRPHPDR